MKGKIWILFLALLLSIVLIFSGCGSGRAVSSASSDEELPISTSNKPIEEEAGDPTEETLVTDNQDMQGEPENEGQEDSKVQTAKTQTQQKPPAKQNGKKDKPQTETKPKKDVEAPKAQKPAVTISIVGPEDIGIILNTTTVAIDENDTVLEILEKVTDEKNIHLDYKGSGMTAYVRGIHHIYEFDRGAKSGWLYRVNGKTLGEGVGTCIVKDGDQIEFLYTIDLGRDI